MEGYYKNEYDLVMERIEATEKWLLTFDSYWGFQDEAVARSSYSDIRHYVRINGEISPEQKSKLYEIIEQKIEEFPQKIEEKIKEMDREDEERLQAWEKAKSRYKNLSIWHKLKCMLYEQTPRKIIARNPYKKKEPFMTTKEINKLYGGKNDR